METISARRATSISIDSRLLDTLKQRACQCHKNLNDYIEGLLWDSIYHEPNAETMAALHEASSDQPLETLDLDHFQEYIANL